MVCEEKRLSSFNLHRFEQQNGNLQLHEMKQEDEA